MYDVDDVSTPTKIRNSGLIVDELKEVFVDKERVDASSLTTTYQFNRPGIHVIRYRYSNVPADLLYDVESVFDGCSSIKSIKIPEGVVRVYVRCFRGCTKLETMTIPKTLTSFGGYCFDGCVSLTKLYITDFNAFLNTNLAVDNSSSFFSTSPGGTIYLNKEPITNLVIPSSRTEIKNYLFYNNTGLVSVSIPESVKTIGTGTFNGCSNVINWDVDFGNFTTVRDHAFRYCKNLPENLVLTNLTSIGLFSFANTNIKTVNLPVLPRTPDGDRNSSMFALCNDLTAITFSENLVYLGRHPFSRNANSNLVVTFPPTTPPATNSGYPTEWFYNGRYGRAFYVPAESLEAYRTAPVWSNYAAIIQPIP